MKKLLTLSVIAAMAFAFGGRGFGAGQGMHGNRGGANMTSYIYSMPKQDLDDTEIADIKHMREEEKLARDVYLTLYNKWHLQVFNNIAKSEQNHMDAMKALIDKYGLTDPVVDDSVGVFSDPQLQELYTQLVNQGSNSIVDALKVGATIEDLDIKDLEDAKETTDNDDVRFVYNNLEKGSRNHLRAFVGVLERYGASYSPQYISEDYYEEIISTPRERGMVR